MTEALALDTEVELSQALAHEYVLGNGELPIANHRQEIEAALTDHSVTILVAPTGSGKTTQVPQFAREMWSEGAPLFDEIIVTQPRIVAARTVSERVAEEISLVDQADRVGYYTSKESSGTPQKYQDIAFLTDGKAAAQLLHQGKKPNPDTKRLLIIDEVHEWNLNIEQLIAIAAEKTDPDSPLHDPNLKVVIMSATIDSKRLQKHFGHLEPPVIEVEVPTHKVTRALTNRGVASVALSLAARSKDKVLAFLAGKGEIQRVATQIAERQSDPAKAVQVVPLHGQQTADEQREAFLDYPDGVVVATTNAAETSLTVPGAIAVVDSGEVRVDRVSYDLVPTGSDGLYLTDASQANLDQRAGRVGRTGPGKYVLCSPDGKIPPVSYADRPEYATPAMERTRLDGLLLRLKATNHEIGDFRFFHEPPPEAVKAAQTRLHILGALDQDGTITERGLQMDKLPLDPEYSCMIAFANEKGYSDEVKQHVLDIVAIMQLGGIFKRSPKDQEWRELLAKDARDDITETDSDFIAQLEAYIKLVSSPDKADWGSYGINEYAAGLIEQGRVSLADKLGVALHEPVVMSPEHREAVLTCINAGQLNQLWQRDGSSWSLVLEDSLNYKLSESSVVSNIGELATGSLFSLGLRDDVMHAIQNVNRVPGLGSLEQAAGHLVREVVDTSTVKYDPERQQLVAQVNKMLGSLVLRSFPRIIETDSDSQDNEIIRKSHSEYAWTNWPEHKQLKTVYTLETIGDAIENPESAQYGVDPFTGEPLLAWRGGKGNWCRTREIAVQSLESCQVRLNTAPQKAELRAVKADVRAVSSELIALKNRGQSVAEVKALLASKKKADKTQWLEKARNLLENAKDAQSR